MVVISFLCLNGWCLSLSDFILDCTGLFLNNNASVTDMLPNIHRVKYSQLMIHVQDINISETARNMYCCVISDP